MATTTPALRASCSDHLPPRNFRTLRRMMMTLDLILVMTAQGRQRTLYASSLAMWCSHAQHCHHHELSVACAHALEHAGSSIPSEQLPRVARQHVHRIHRSSSSNSCFLLWWCSHACICLRLDNTLIDSGVVREVGNSCLCSRSKCRASYFRLIDACIEMQSNLQVHVADPVNCFLYACLICFISPLQCVHL